MIGKIYKMTCLINNKPYIGQTRQTIKKRIKNHETAAYNKNNIQYNYPLSRAIRKYGIGFFMIEEIYHTRDFDDLNDVEKQFIKIYKSRCYEWGYNILEGGMGRTGVKLSEETKRKMSEAQKGNKYCLGRKHTEETKRKIGEAQRGRKHTEEAKRKMSEAAKGRKGKKWTEEAKRRMSEAQKGSKNYFYGKKHTEETKRKMSEAAKKRWKREKNE